MHRRKKKSASKMVKTPTSTPSIPQSTLVTRSAAATPSGDDQFQARRYAPVTACCAGRMARVSCGWCGAPVHVLAGCHVSTDATMMGVKKGAYNNTHGVAMMADITPSSPA